MKVLKLKLLAGSTYYIDGSSIVGLYLFEDRSCLLVDTGSGGERAAALLELLEEKGIRVRGIFNTHFHADHCGGNRRIQERMRCRIYVSAPDAPFLQNPILAPLTLYAAYPPPPLRNRYLMAPPCVVTDLLETGRLTIEGVSFRILDLKGHTLGHKGLVTPDGVAFLGDALLAPEILQRFPLHYLADVKGQLETLALLREENCEIAVLSHGGLLRSLGEAVDDNRESLEKNIELTREFLRLPHNREEILCRLAGELHLPLNTTQYYLILATVSAYLSYLCSRREVRADPAGWVMRYYAVPPHTGRRQGS